MSPDAATGMLLRPDSGSAREGASGIALTTRGLTKTYGGLTVLEAANLDVHSGSLVSILGPSGSGKTTLLQCIAGFVRPDAGAVHVGGRDVTWAPPHKRNLGLVFQSHALFGHMSVLDNVAFGLRMRKLSRSDARNGAREALKLVRLDEFEGRYPRQLSGGQQQRVALARALVISPSALLLDEPLSSLDRTLRDELRSEIRRLQLSLATPTLFVTHDQEEALAISDKVVVMNEGRIEQVGTPAELYDVPRTPFVATFLGSSNVLEGRFVTDGDPPAFQWGPRTFPTPVPDAPQPRSREASIVVKPDTIAFAESMGEIPQGMAAVEGVLVQSVEFLGRASLVTCEIDGVQLRARVSRGASTPTPGSTVCIFWDPSDSHLILGRGGDETDGA